MPCSSSPNASCSSSTGKTSSNAKEPFDTICGAVGKNYSSGFFTGNKKDSDRTYLFATRNTMSRHYEEFSADSFDYIVIDEAHQPDWPILKSHSSCSPASSWKISGLLHLVYHFCEICYQLSVAGDMAVHDCARVQKNAIDFVVRFFGFFRILGKNIISRNITDIFRTSVFCRHDKCIVYGTIWNMVTDIIQKFASVVLVVNVFSISKLLLFPSKKDDFLSMNNKIERPYLK